MLLLYRFLNGYLRVLFYGEYSERVLNLAAANRIFLWDSRLTVKGIEACIAVKDFLRLPEILKKSGVRAHILKKYGLSFKLSKNRKRLGIVIGFIIFAVFLYTMSGYIWIIEVEGNKNISEEEIIKACNQIGIKEGIRAKSINAKTEREKLLLELDSLAWASLNIEGCRLTVNVSEIRQNGGDNSCICNLKAKADGIIKRIDVTSGNCVVRTGDTVKKGDILVSGIIEKLSKTEFVHSAGAVTAVTERSITVEGEYETENLLETGKVKVKRVLEIFNIKIPLYLGGENAAYKSENNVKGFKLFGKRLPVKIYEKSFIFCQNKKTVLSREELCEKLRLEVSKRLENEGVEEFETLSEKFTDTEKGLRLTALVSAEENIVYRDAIILEK